MQLYIQSIQFKAVQKLKHCTKWPSLIFNQSESQIQLDFVWTIYVTYK